MKKTILSLILSIMLSVALHATTFEQDTFKTQNGTSITITFFKHATLMIQYGNYTIQVDPISKYVDYTTYPKADLILHTHEHGDHLDPVAVKTLEKKETMLIGTTTTYATFNKGNILKNGEKITINSNIIIEAVPAYNITAGREKLHPKGRGNGYVLTLDNFKIYIAGDTEDIPELANLKDIDIAFLPTNQPYTMTVEQAIHAANMFGPKVLYPYHCGNTKVEDIAKGLDGSKVDVRLRKM